MSKSSKVIIHLLEDGKKIFTNSFMSTEEKIEGVLHLINYRLIFQPHVVNDTKGILTIFLNTILDVEDVSKVI